MKFDFSGFAPVSGHAELEEFLLQLGTLISYGTYRRFRSLVNAEAHKLGIAAIPSYKALSPKVACLIVGKSGKPGAGAPDLVHSAYEKLGAKVRGQVPLSPANAAQLAAIFIAGVK